MYACSSQEQGVANPSSAAVLVLSLVLVVRQRGCVIKRLMFISTKLKVFNKKKKDFVLRQIYEFYDKFKSIMHVKEVLSEGLSDSVSAFGYFEGKQHTKRWLVSESDLQRMYSIFDREDEVFLWFNIKDESENTAPAKRKTTMTLEQQAQSDKPGKRSWIHYSKS